MNFGKFGIVFGILFTLAPFAWGGMPADHSPVPAQFYTPRELPMVDPKVARYDNACVNFAATIVSNAESSQPEVSQWRQECNHHPTRDICLETAEMVKSSRGSNMGLTCTGGPNDASLDHFVTVGSL